MTIGCFIDYDNLTEKSKLEGVLNCITIILDSFNSNLIQSINRVEIRIYGGWYDMNANLTNNAILLSNEIDRSFPSILTFIKHGALSRFICNAELAFSLIEIPGEIYYNTYRRKVLNNSYKPLSKEKIECKIDNCIAEQIHNCFSSKKCINPECLRPIDDFIHRSEQKMVDSLIICDVLHGTSLFDHSILVSSDEDFIPLIRTFLNRNSNLTLVETKSNQINLLSKYNLRINNLSL